MPRKLLIAADAAAQMLRLNDVAGFNHRKALLDRQASLRGVE